MAVFNYNSYLLMYYFVPLFFHILVSFQEIIHKFEQITSAVTNFANDICDDSPDEEILNISSVSNPSDLLLLQ